MIGRKRRAGSDEIVTTELTDAFTVRAVSSVDVEDHDGFDAFEADGAGAAPDNVSADGTGDGAGDDVGDDEDETGRLIRPYAITGGRTGTDGPTIDLESQVLSTPQGTLHADDHRWEARRVIELTGTPMALVEISARLEIPIGVTRVLVADLVQAGHVSVHVPVVTKNYTSLLEQVLDGVRAL